MPAAMSEEEYWAWYAASTGRKDDFAAEAKDETSTKTTEEKKKVSHTTLVEQIKEAEKYDVATALAKTHSTTMSFVGAVEVLHTLAQKHRWTKAWGCYEAPDAVKVLAEKINIGLTIPSKITPAIACTALYGLAKFDHLDEKLVKALQKHAEADWDPKHTIAPEHAAHFVWAVVMKGVRLEHSFFMAMIDTIKIGCKRLSNADMAEITWAIQKGAVTVEGGVRRTTQEDALFEAIASRLIAEVADIDPEYLVEIIHNFASLGLKHERMLKALCPKLLAAKLNERRMAKCILAYTRFSVPFRDTSQGYRQTAQVIRGDFQRPSEKPPKKKQKYDKPTAVGWKQD